MGQIHFVFGVHNHQPVGNFEEVFKWACQNAYQPFVEVLQKHPKISMTFHFSGILLSWIENNQPEIIGMLKEMVEEKRVEIMTGGFYEPILPMIPDRDKIGQINKLTKYIKKLFGVTPRGMWLAERVWEPMLAKPIVEAGVEYVVMDDSHFKYAGVSEKDLFGYFETEEQGYKLNLFPISEEMRYLVPFWFPKKTIEYFTQIRHNEGDKIVVLADDGEKFGVWPGTHKSVYKEGWLKQFFAILEENSDWIKIRTFSQILDSVKPQGIVYVPDASYTEMMEWALPPENTAELEDILHDLPHEHDNYKKFIKGGFWRNFLAKYPESNNMHKKMLHVGKMIDELPENRKSKALDELWTAQCNCSYWHGVFGGLYLNHIRTAIFEHLIKAEIIIDSSNHKNKNWVEVVDDDILYNGSRTMIVRNSATNWYLDVTNGVSLYELDYKPKSFNLVNTMSRRQEAYHRKLASAVSLKESTVAKSIHDVVVTKEPHMEKHLAYDWHRRSALIDHFMDLTSSLEEFRMVRYSEEGDFVNQPYELLDQTEDKGSLTLTFKRDGNLWRADGVIPLSLTKKLEFPAGSATCIASYLVDNTTENHFTTKFGIEFGFSLQAGNTPDRYYIIPKTKLKDNKLGTVGEIKEVQEVTLVEEWLGLKVRLSWDKPATLWRFPIETISNSEGGFERSYQSSVVMPNWDLELIPDRKWEVKIKLEVIEI